MIIQKIKRKIILYSALCTTTCALFLISLARYNAGQMFYYDFGIFTHIIFQLSRFQLPIINHLVLGKVIFLGDHFNPSLVLIAPIFWITTDHRILLLQQAFAITIATWFVYKIAKKSNLPHIASIALAIAYLVFAGTLNPLVTDWHPESTAAAVLLAFIYTFLLTQKKYIALMLYLIFIGFKESNAITGAIILLWVAITNKHLRIQSALYITASILYALAMTQYVIPKIAAHPYLYTPQIPTNPKELAYNFFGSEHKIKLIQDCLISFAGLPLFSGTALIMPILELGIRLFPKTTIYNNISLGQHYNVLLGVALTLATYQTFLTINKKFNNKKYILILLSCMLIATSLFTARKITASPINLLINPVFYQSFTKKTTLYKVLAQVPPQGSVMAQNNVLAYVANRTDELYLPKIEYETKQPKIIIINTAHGANINNYYGASKQIVQQIHQKLQKDNNYKEIKFENEYYLYIKK